MTGTSLIRFSLLILSGGGSSPDEERWGQGWLAEQLREPAERLGESAPRENWTTGSLRQGRQAHQVSQVLRQLPQPLHSPCLETQIITKRIKHLRISLQSLLRIPNVSRVLRSQNLQAMPTPIGWPRSVGSAVRAG